MDHTLEVRGVSLSFGGVRAIRDVSFDIRKGGKTYEVGVDAKSGKILENKAEGPNPD